MRSATIVLVLGMSLFAGCGGTSTPSSPATVPAPIEAPAAVAPTDPLDKALSPTPVFTCGRPRAPRPAWRRALTKVANGLGLDTSSRVAIYDVLPSGLSNVLKR